LKSSDKLFRHTLFACALAISPVFLLNARAQNQSTANPVQAQPAEASAGQFAGATDSPEAALARQKRAQGYAKFLLGQRLLSNIRNSESDSSATVKLAQQAFQEALQLDPTLAEAYTAQAEIALFYQRNIDEAMRLANSAIKVNRNNFGAHQMLSRIYGLKSGLNRQSLDKTNAESAIASLREAVRLVPNDAEAWALLGELYLALGRTEEAIAALARWSAAPPSADPRFFTTITGGRELTQDAAAARLGEALMRAGRAREAINAIRRAISLNPESGAYQELLSRAIESSGGDDASLIAELRGMVATEPQNIALAIMLARVQTRAGRSDDAAQTLRASLNRRPASDKEGILTLRLALAQTYADALRYAEAVNIYEELLKEQGITGSAPLTKEEDRRMAGELLRRIVTLQKNAEKPSEALQTIERMRRLLGNDDPTIELEHIELLRDQGKQREALQTTRAARRKFPQQDEFLYLEANILTDMGQIEEAVALLRARLTTGVESSARPASSIADFDLYLRIASLYIQARRGTEAVAAARQALERAPADRQDMIAAALITLSSAQDRAGDAKGSEESLRRLLDQDPENATALNNLGYFLVERNERLQEALQMIQRAVKAEPTNPSFLDSLGWAYFKLGQLAEAERNLAEAARRNNGSATIQEHLGDVYQRLGKPKEARAAWEKALKLLSEGEQAQRIRGKLSGNSK
jgi:tetratricopeptide (TPR) repeat protein